MTSRGLCTPGNRIIAAVSGGPDSMALVEILARIARKTPFELAVAHFEHGIRPGAGRERSLVERRARTLGLPFFAGAADVPVESRRLKKGIEESARILRHRFLEEAAASWSATAVALGHTRDDQVETILLNIIRGAGWRGIAGMPPRRGIFIRPLLGCGRDELREMLRRARVRYAVDPSNRDTKMLRNRVRHVLLPLLRRRFNPSMDRALLRLADNISEARSALEAGVRAIIPRGGRDEIRVPLSAVERLDAFERYLLVDIVLRERLGIMSDIEKMHYDSFKRLAAAGRSGTRIIFPRGAEIVREQRHLLFRRAGPAEAKPASVIGGPGTHIAPAWNLSIVVERIAAPRRSSRARKREAVFASLSFPIVVRSRRPGDRMRPLGMNGRKKLSDLMIDRKVPISRRDSTPVFEDAGGIFWVPGVAVDERARVEPGRGRAVRIRLSSVRRGF